MPLLSRWKRAVWRAKAMMLDTYDLSTAGFLSSYTCFWCWSPRFHFVPVLCPGTGIPRHWTILPSVKDRRLYFILPFSK